MLRGRAVNLDIMVKRPKNSDPGAFNYQVRTGPIESRDQAADVCETLRKAGHSGCLVIRHDGLKWRNVASTDADGDTMSGDVKPGLTASGDLKPGQLKTGHLKTDRPAAGESSEEGPDDGEVAAVPVQQPARAPAASDDDDLAAPSYRVQLASFRTASGAAKGQAVLQKLLGDRDVDLDILVRKDRNNTPQAFDYKIRTSPIQSRAEGNGICEVLQQAGHLGCLVIRHNEQMWHSLADASERRNASVNPLKTPTKSAPTEPAGQPADPVNLVIELPSAAVMESGIPGSGELDGIETYPAIPIVSPSVQTEI
jgi:hypothetical protein